MSEETPAFKTGRDLVKYEAELIGAKEVLAVKIDTLKELMNERDRLYISKFEESKVAVSAALAAQEKSTANAFLASEKAVLKAEDAQKDYNQRSNEFRGQLDDQAKTLMPRLEAVTMFKAFEEKLETVKIGQSKDIDILRNEIASLREFRSQTTGVDLKDAKQSKAHAWMVPLMILGTLQVLGLIISVIAMFMAKH
jgi:hypothetical protein